MEAVDCLLQAKAEIESANTAGCTALHIAARSGIALMGCVVGKISAGAVGQVIGRAVNKPSSTAAAPPCTLQHAQEGEDCTSCTTSLICAVCHLSIHCRCSNELRCNTICSILS